jgi:hypothetical protein
MTGRKIKGGNRKRGKIGKKRKKVVREKQN